MQNETGRSLVEILGVLAIIGVLSVAGVAGFKNAMEKNRANTIISEAQKRAVVVAGQIGFNNGTPSLADFLAHNTVSGGTFGDVVTTGLTGQFAIPVSGVSQKVCQNILNTIGNNTTIRRLSSLSTPRTPMNNCEDENSFLIIYNNNLQGVGNDVQYCSTHDDCDECGTCNQTTHTCIDKCESACNENDTCGENECVVCDEDSKTCQNKCEKVEYLESDGEQYILSGFTPTVNTDFEIVLSSTNTKTTWVVGSPTWVGVHYKGAASQVGITNSSTAAFQQYTTYNLDDSKLTMKLEGNTVYANGVSLGTITRRAGTLDFALFAYRDINQGAALNYIGKIYKFWMKENGIFVREFIPVLSPDGEACMFDKVSQKLFCNAGSGTFKTNLDE